jgi:hypothetical protein
MAAVADAQGAQQKTAPRLTVIDGEQGCAGGELAESEEPLAGLLEQWTPLLEPGCDPLSAELTGAEFLAMMREAVPVENELSDLVAALIEQAERHGTPEALAMLRVLAVVGPPEVQSAAAGAADRLVQAGLTDPLWVTGLGRPRVGQCFGYADARGAQEVIVIIFAYGSKQHALAVLIDHDLGGGIKDCFPTEHTRRIRADYQKAATGHGLDFHDYEPAQARAILDRALAKQPCPVEPDQIEDVGDYLNLLRARVLLLPEGDTVSPTKTDRARKRLTRAGGGPTVHKVKITLRGSTPPIWRRLEVPSSTTLQHLHRTIQEAFGWESYHLWVFQTPTDEYGVADRELGHRSAASTKLHDIAPRAGDRIRYTYDFGDDWEHDLLVEDVFPAEPGVTYPQCLTGRRACPPEDCGGIWGYQELLEILTDPATPSTATDSNGWGSPQPTSSTRPPSISPKSTRTSRSWPQSWPRNNLPHRGNDDLGIDRTHPADLNAHAGSTWHCTSNAGGLQPPLFVPNIAHHSRPDVSTTHRGHPRRIEPRTR